MTPYSSARACDTYSSPPHRAADDAVVPTMTLPPRRADYVSVVIKLIESSDTIHNTRMASWLCMRTVNGVVAFSELDYKGPAMHVVGMAL